MVLIMLAGLRSLPKEPFEAAAIDGATPVQVFFKLTLPMMSKVIAIAVLIRGIDLFRAFELRTNILQPLRHTGVLGHGFCAKQAQVSTIGARVAEKANTKGREAHAGHAHLPQEVALGNTPSSEITCGIGDKRLFVIFSETHFTSSHWFIV